MDNLQLLFVWAPVINVQLILEGIFIGAIFALCLRPCACLGGDEYQNPPRVILSLPAVTWLLAQHVRPATFYYFTNSCHIHVYLWMDRLSSRDQTHS